MELYVGQTFRATISDLVDAAGTPITNPTVAISMVTPDGTETAGTVIQNRSTYYAEFIPTTPGFLHVKAEATLAGVAWRTKEQLAVKAY